MATPSEIIGSRDIKGLPVSNRIHNVVDTTGGLTDELYNAQIMRSLGNTAPAYLEEAEYSEEPGIPTLDVVLSKLGVKADNDPTGIKAARKFVEDFAKKQSIWKKKIERDPDLGKRGWNTVVDLFKKTSNDLMNYEIAEGRKRIASGADEKGFDWLQTKLANLVAPRVVKAVEEGRDPEMNEIVRDVVSNAAYAVPVGRVAKILSKGAPAAVKVGAQGLSQAAAPTFVAGMDYAVDPEYDLQDAATDATVGTLANLGVNKVLGPAIGRGLSTAMGKVSSRVPPSVKAILEGSSTPRELADETIANAEKKLAQAEEKFASGNLREGVATSIPKDERASAEGIKEIADAAGKTLQVSKDKALSPSEVIQAVERATKGNLKKSNESDVIGSVVQQLNHPKTAPTVQNPKVSKEFREGAKRYSKIIEANPELKTLFAPQPKFSVGNVLVPAETYAVNQYGSSSNAANVAGASIPGMDVKKAQADNASRKAKSDAQGAIGKILSASPDLTDEDQKYLRMVEENPDVLKFSQDDGLKQWLLRRGHSILQGTPAHRPLWEVR